MIPLEIRFHPSMEAYSQKNWKTEIFCNNQSYNKRTYFEKLSLKID